MGALPSSVGSALNHRNPYEPVIGVFDRTSGLEKPRDLAKWRPWARTGQSRMGKWPKNEPAAREWCGFDD